MIRRTTWAIHVTASCVLVMGFGVLAARLLGGFAGSSSIC